MALHLYIGFAQPDEWANWAGTYARHVERFEEASGGVPCLTLPFYHVSASLMDRLKPDVVILSGFARSFEDYKTASFLPVIDWVKRSQTPTLALCGSHQLLGFAYNSDLRKVSQLKDEPMRRLETGEPITNPDYHPEFFMERGFYHVRLTPEGKRDPLFANLGDAPIFCESHYCEIKRLPTGFRLLGSTPECHIQAMRHAERPLYGVQFHPEDYNERFSAGRTLLQNFFKIVALMR